MIIPPKSVAPYRRRPSLVATRVTPAEKAWITALARTEGRTVTELIYSLVMPEVKERLGRSLEESPVEGRLDMTMGSLPAEGTP